MQVINKFFFRNQKLTSCLIAFMLMPIGLLAQSPPKGFPVVGEKCPDFVLNDVRYYKNTKTSLTELRGQNVILDFWAVTCGACIAAFPKMNEFQKKYEGRLQIFLVAGASLKGRDERKAYEIIKDKYQLSLASAYDAVAYKRLVRPGTIPHLILIDKEGVVRGIASSLTDSAVDSFVNGRTVDFVDKSETGRQDVLSKVNMDKPLFINHNGGADTSYLFRSVLAKWDSKRSINHFHPVYGVPAGGRISYQATGVSLSQLYSLAFFGALYSDIYNAESTKNIVFNPNIQVRDIGLFKSRQGTGEGLYSYSIQLPSEGRSKKDLLRMMQMDLEKYFGFKATVEEAEVPCLKLIIIDKQKIDLIRGDLGKEEIQWNLESSNNFLQNVTVEKLIRMSTYELDGEKRKMLKFDETGIQGSVSLKFKGRIDDFENIRMQLNDHGLDLVQSTKRMKVLMIRDAE